MHVDDPCIHCGVTHDDVSTGPCSKSGGIAAIARRMHFHADLLAKGDVAWKAEAQRLRQLIAADNTAITQAADGLDVEKIALAETVAEIGTYANGGEGRLSVVADAIKWFATQKPIDRYHGDLRRAYFGTKNYDRWSGQREDHQYGMGPRHGYIVFSVGLKRDARERALTPDEQDACIYYLTNIERIQAARQKAA